MASQGDVEFEHWVLTSPEGLALLDEVAKNRSPRPADLTRWRKTHRPEHVSAALRIADGRRRGRAKFARADAMWFDAVGLEQATAEPVARHKARRFQGSPVLDLCCGIGGDALALAAAEAQRVFAVDADPGMCRRVRWNATVNGVNERIEPVQARAEQMKVDGHDQLLVHVDPDRRKSKDRRARTVEEYRPGLPYLKSLMTNARGGAIKLSPASDFLDLFGNQPLELELISLGGECKEATVWFGALAGDCRRRATRLPEGATWTEHDGPVSPYVAVSEPSRWVYDPDPSLGRSGLLHSFAQVHGLRRCGPSIDFLTSDTLVLSPFLAPFETQDVLPLDLKTLKRVVATKALGPLEIKVKGLDLRPESVRARLKPKGPNPATLLLMGGSGPGRAIVGRRVQEPSAPIPPTA